MGIDWALHFHDFGSDDFWRLVGKLRDAVWEEALEADMSLIMTFVYGAGEILDPLDRISALVESAGGRTCFVQLTCNLETLKNRVESPERVAAGKLASVPGLLAAMAKNDLYRSLPGHESLSIDNTDLTPEEVAEQIVREFALA
jgi:hypothetical protein